MYDNVYDLETADEGPHGAVHFSQSHRDHARFAPSLSGHQTGTLRKELYMEGIDPSLVRAGAPLSLFPHPHYPQCRRFLHYPPNIPVLPAPIYMRTVVQQQQ